jgi:hypothetical protein
VVTPSAIGKPVMKSKLIISHGRVAMGRGKSAVSGLGFSSACFHALACRTTFAITRESFTHT